MKPKNPELANLIRAARRWSALDDMEYGDMLDWDVKTNGMIDIIDALQAAIRSYEKSQGLRRLKVGPK